MEKHKSRVKFHNRKIVCASEILCADCPQKDGCEEVIIFIEDAFDGVENCMTHDGYKRKNKRIQQTCWGKD